MIFFLMLALCVCVGVGVCVGVKIWEFFFGRRFRFFLMFLKIWGFFGS